MMKKFPEDEYARQRTTRTYDDFKTYMIKLKNFMMKTNCMTTIHINLTYNWWSYFFTSSVLQKINALI